MLVIEINDELVTKLLLELHEPFKVEERREIAANFLTLAYERGFTEGVRKGKRKITPFKETFDIQPKSF